ncbi:ABC transporter permease subunit [Escherichia coli]
MERTNLAVFAINGLMVAIAGLILSSRLGAGSPLREISPNWTMAACVIGGTAWLAVGSVAGAVMGAFIMASLDNGMSMMDVPTFWQYIVKGAILLLAVWMDSATKRRFTDFDKNFLKAGYVLPVFIFCMIQQEKNHVY